LVTDIKEYNYGSAVRGTLLRETAYSYAVIGSYLTDRVASIQKYDGAGNEYAATTYGYDSPVATGTTGLPQHVAVSGPRGNLTSQQVWTSSTAHLDTGYTTPDSHISQQTRIKAREASTTKQRQATVMIRLVRF